MKAVESTLTRYESQRRNNQIPGADFEQPIPLGSTLSIEPDLLEDDVLVEIDTVEPRRAIPMSKVRERGAG